MYENRLDQGRILLAIEEIQQKMEWDNSKYVSKTQCHFEFYHSRFLHL